MTEQLQKALDALAACGTPDDVADLLRRAGVKGLPCRAGCCPVANFVVAAGADGPSVSNARIMGYAGPGGGVIDLETPPAVARFVDAFDRGEYRDLNALA